RLPMHASFSWSACLSACHKATLTSPAQTQQTISNRKKTRALSFIDWSRLFEGTCYWNTTRRQPLAWLGANPGNRNRLLAPADSTKINLPRKQQNQVVVQFAFSVGRAAARAGSSVASPHQTVPLPKIRYLWLRTWPCGREAKLIPFRFSRLFHRVKPFQEPVIAEG